MAVSVFQFNDYREFLRAQIQSLDRSWGMITSLAKAAGCRRPYLSKVLHGAAALSAQQAHGIARFCELTTLETEYLLLLVEWDRTASGPYKQYLQSMRDNLRRRHEDLARRVARTSHAVESGFVDYYSAWAASGGAQAPRYARISGEGAVDEITARAMAALAG